MKRKRGTIQEIAIKPGVNPSTVSRVINNSEKYKISEAVRKNVRDIMDELKYEPQAYAQSIKTWRSFYTIWNKISFPQPPHWFGRHSAEKPCNGDTPQR